MQTVEDEGANFGLGDYAKDIQRMEDGRYVVANPVRRAEILKLRENPEAASVMAGAFASRNAAELSTVLSRQPTSGELYIAHFLGAAGAKKFLTINATQPTSSAAAAFPEAAGANRSIFYRRDGSAKSVVEVYAGLTSRHDRSPSPPVEATSAVAAVSSVQASNAKFATVVTPDRTAERQTVAAFDYAPYRSYSSFTPENTPAYRSLYQPQAGGGTHGLSRSVQELWSRDSSQKVALVDTTKVSRVAEVAQPQPGIATVAMRKT